MTTVLEKSPAISIRESHATIRALRQQLKEDLFAIEAMVRGKDKEYERAVDAGEGPPSPSEIQALQTKRWEILTSHKQAIEKHLADIATATQQAVELCDDAKMNLTQFELDSQDRSIATLGITQKEAAKRADADPDLIALRQLVASMGMVRGEIKHLSPNVEKAIADVDDQRKLLSKRWRTI